MTRLVGYATAIYLAVLGMIALLWTVTWSGYPLGVNDPQGDTSVLRLLPPSVAAPLFAGVLLTTAAVAYAAAATRPPRWVRLLLTGYGVGVALALAVVVPDTRVLIVLAYLPVLVAGAPFGWPPVAFSDVFDVALLAKVLALVAGVLIAATLVVWRRRALDACLSCGRAASGAATSPIGSASDPVVVWGRRATYTAAAIPVTYALVRIAWALGIPLGITREFLDELFETGLVWAGLWLGLFAVGGAVLTLGLVQRWGEVFPRWTPWLAGRRVPIALAVVPATLVSLSVTAAGTTQLIHPEFWAMFSWTNLAVLPALLWPLWGVALGGATAAYHLRRRGACRVCGQGTVGSVRHPIEGMTAGLSEIPL